MKGSPAMRISGSPNPNNNSKMSQGNKMNGSGGSGSGLRGNRGINRRQTSPTTINGVHEIRHNILMAGSGFMTGVVGTQGPNQSEGRGLSNFFVKKLGGPNSQNSSIVNKKKRRAEKKSGALPNYVPVQLRGANN
jgi:hypothetical protein